MYTRDIEISRVLGVEENWAVIFVVGVQNAVDRKLLLIIRSILEMHIRAGSRFEFIPPPLSNGVSLQS